MACFVYSRMFHSYLTFSSSMTLTYGLFVYSRMLYKYDLFVSCRMLHNYLTWRVLEQYVQDLSWEYVHANRQLSVDKYGYQNFLGTKKYCFLQAQRYFDIALGVLYIRTSFDKQNKNKVGVLRVFMGGMWWTGWGGRGGLLILNSLSTATVRSGRDTSHQITEKSLGRTLNHKKS